MVGANPTPTKICILHHQHQKQQPQIPTKTCRNHFQQPKKHAKSTFPKNAFKEPILHWYQWQVHKAPSRPMVLLWNPASLVPKPIQQLILDHPGSRGFRMGGSSLETSDVDVVLNFNVFMAGSLEVKLI